MGPLTPAQVADLLHLLPTCTSPTQVDRSTGDFTDAQLEELAGHLGLVTLAHEFQPVFLKVVLAAQRMARDSPPEYPDKIDDLIENFDVLSLDEHFLDEGMVTPPPSSPEPPTMPVTARMHIARSRSTPVTPQPSCEYTVSSPGKTTLHATNWFHASTLTKEARGPVARRVNKSTRNKPTSSTYTVFFGGEVRVFEAWEDAQRSVTGHGLALFSGFPNVQAATTALEYARSMGWTADSQLPPSTTASIPAPDPSADNPLNIGAAGSGVWYAICKGVRPGIYCSYLECGFNVSGIKGTLFSTFDTCAEAEGVLADAQDASWVEAIPRVVPL
ncbi:hypothetical protein DFH07DRAFT_781906 [Mycena maculata]|uniref:Ribonuclease H1 N-terminal domain-containing protein n=1 Tax=Mycena maculata TaxID=230809 RepID=A0AAD7HWV7_9AGAR|nr:hypothetical protein DFH07DRAFT_781906 [Mycena maculata]